MRASAIDPPRPRRRPARGRRLGRVDPETGLIEALLPRRTSISRKEVWQRTREQVLAANVDVAFLVQALPLDFNVRRLERYLAMAWESGAQPVVLLTKTDLVDDVTPYLAEVETVTLGACPVDAVSARTGAGLEIAAGASSTGNRTAVLLGSSGVGKSTIVNALVGEEVLATQEVREDDQRGRHTTSHRELSCCPAAASCSTRRASASCSSGTPTSTRPSATSRRSRRRCRFSDCAPRPGAGLRDPRRARRRDARTGPLAELREAAARARGASSSGATTCPTGTRPGVQDSRTGESTEAQKR